MSAKIEWLVLEVQFTKFKMRSVFPIGWYINDAKYVCVDENS